MALPSSTIQTTATPANQPKEAIGGEVVASVLSAVVLSIYAGQKSRKQLRKLKRKMTWLLIKEKMRNAFAKPADIDRKTLTIILLGVLVLALVFISPVAALVLAILGLILILAGVV
ncbi:MAG TPA: hypothetical protein VEZ55_01855 [Chitinophagaceae bacterium]|nr:hypothetical protein [Chitinophagaceae bacterium]